MTETERAQDGVEGLQNCPACPDGYIWNSSGPTGRACKVCNGYAVVNLNGSPLTPEQILSLHG